MFFLWQCGFFLGTPIFLPQYINISYLLSSLWDLLPGQCPLTDVNSCIQTGIRCPGVLPVIIHLTL